MIRIIHHLLFILKNESDQSIYFFQSIIIVVINRLVRLKNQFFHMTFANEYECGSIKIDISICFILLLYASGAKATEKFAFPPDIYI